MNPLLAIKNLSINFGTKSVVNNISFSVFPGETVALLGESGSGKSVTAGAIMRLLNAKVSGEIAFEDTNLLTLNEKKMREVRGKKIGIIFQDPMTSLNPTLTIGKQIMEGAITKEKALSLLHAVGISEPQKRFRQYPFELSGGMRQRVMIAIAISHSPKLLIADEPTTALDTTIQTQILELLKQLQKDLKMATLLITHDLRIVAGIADRVLVMYAGSLVEMGSVSDIYHSPSHPYTEALLRSLPRLDLDKKSALHPIPGSPPYFSETFSGCPFAPRCHKKLSNCSEKSPPLIQIKKDHFTNCWHYENFNRS